MVCYSPSYFVQSQLIKPAIAHAVYYTCIFIYIIYLLEEKKVSNETQRQALLQHFRDLKRHYRANMSDEQLHKQREVDSQYHHHMRNQETEEQREARQQQDREHHTQMRLHEAEEQRGARQQQDREHHRQMRLQEASIFT